MSRTIGFFFVLLAGIGFGFLGIFGRIAFSTGLSVGEFLAWRFAFASVLLWIGLLIFKPQLVRLPLKQILISFALGGLGYAVFSTLYFKAIEGVSVPLAALLLFTFPIFVNLGNHFILKDRMTKLQTLSLLTACIGLGILLWGPMVVQSATGILFGLGSGFTYGIYVLVSGRVQKNVSPLSSSLYVITSTALVFFLIHQPNPIALQEFSPTQWGAILGIAVVSTIGPLTFFLAGLQRMPSSQASIVAISEPVVAAFAASFLLGENLSNFQLVGAGVVLVSLVLSMMDKTKS